MLNKQFLIFTLALLFVLGLAGCSETQSLTLPALPSAADAQKAVCDSLTGINNNIAALGNVSATSTVNDIKALKANLDTAVQAVKAANSVLNRPTITEMTNAYDSLALQINGLPDGQTIGATAEANIEAGVTAVLAALGQARTALSCP